MGNVSIRSRCLDSGKLAWNADYSAIAYGHTTPPSVWDKHHTRHPFCSKYANQSNNKMIVDTQVLSYYYKGTLPIPSDPISISSITASEFLLVYSKEHNRANYYPLLPSRFRFLKTEEDGSERKIVFTSRRHAARGKRRTDQIILDFGSELPVYVEYGSAALTQLINGRHEELYISGIGHLSKKLQKKLRRRFRFLLDLPLQCIALDSVTIDTGMNLLSQFFDRYQPKRNIRNTVNDTLILATAINSSVRLLTEDGLLQRFGAQVMHAPTEVEDSCLLTDYSVPVIINKRKPFESKGYINRGWQVHERKAK